MTMTDWESEILNVLDGPGGLVTGDVSSSTSTLFGHNKRTHSAFIRGVLLELERKGLVKRLDDLKPVCWLRVDA